MDETEFRERTMLLGLSVIGLSREIKHDLATDVLLRQVIRSSTSVGANYRAACRARSDSEMLSKLATVEEEADESCHWLEMLIRAGAAPSSRIEPLIQEATEILKMTVASIRTIRSRVNRGDARTQVPAKGIQVHAANNPTSEIRNPK